MINLSPYDIHFIKEILLDKGIIKPYLTTEDDNASGQRMGGFGSTVSNLLALDQSSTTTGYSIFKDGKPVVISHFTAKELI